MALSPNIVEKIRLLEDKFAAMGQDLASYLDGLLYADYLTYWDYIHLDTLLSLQNPRTSFPDEEIFIMYHQITELYFKLCLHEINQIQKKEDLDLAFLKARMRRMNMYFNALVNSFEVMVDGMEQEQFLKFRMSLLPASGFQSGQYRMIEIGSTDFINLVEKDERAKFQGNWTEKNIPEMYEVLYWKKGATELATGKKTLTLLQFEERYSNRFIQLARDGYGTNLLSSFNGLPEAAKQDKELRQAYRQFDVHVNVNWPLAHYKSAVRYLQRNPEDIAATGGTNWQKYLPPRFQKRIFFPDLWSDQEKEDWGKSWVSEVMSDLK